ncbi:MAG: L-arabinose isomerase, partial [Bacteroidota bacterium]
MNNFLANKEVWFITGSQHLYGKEALKNVSSNAQTIAETLNESSLIPLKIVFKPILTTPGNISDLCMEANANSQCVGLITW